MIALEMRNLGGGEILHACPQESLDKPLPCIVFYHGFTSSKLVYSYFAVALAEAGQIDVVITGKQADAAILKQLEDQGVSVIRV